jgi:alkylation response protein AidB-like acyl-CoA dehydrogenase
LDFALTQEQELLRGEVRRFAEERIAPGRRQRDLDHEFPEAILAEMGEMGLLGMMVPEEYGGGGLDALTYVLAVEEIARICPATAVSMSVTNSVCGWPIARFGSPEARGAALPALASGAALGGFGLTEPGSGSDAAALATTARREGDGWVLDGQKAWITHATRGEWFVAFAKTDPTAGKRGISAFAVSASWPGFRRGEREEKLGLRASDTGAIYFEGLRVPRGFLLGSEGEGFKIALATLDHSRLGIGAQAIGIHRRALELAAGYAKERVQFGAPIAEHQVVRFTLARMATDLEASRVLTYYAATIADRSPDAGRLASEAKAFSSEAANRAVWDALQIHGGNGFSEEYEIARLYRDVRVTTIYEGTNEMQRLVIARHLLRR